MIGKGDGGLDLDICPGGGEFLVGPQLQTTAYRMQSNSTVNNQDCLGAVKC